MKQNLFTVIGLVLIGNLAFSVNSQNSASDLAQAVDDAVAKYQSVGSNGATFGLNNEALSTSLVNLPGDVKISAGLVTLPLDFLCNQPTPSLLQAVTCHVCSYDCTFVHNKYGGKCGNDTNPVPGTTQVDSSVCICNDSPPTDGVGILDLQTQCGPIVNPEVDALVDLAVAHAFRARMLLLQCGAPPLPYPLSKPLFGKNLPNVNNAGCKSDCSTNHNYADGFCRYDTPVANHTGELYYGFNCACTH